MPRNIHTRIDPNTGDKVFRVWSTVVDGYITDEMTEEEVIQFWRDETVRVALDNLDRQLPPLMEETKTYGFFHFDPRRDTSTLQDPDWEMERE